MHDEGALRDLVRLLKASGNRARADAVTRGFIERLARELGTSPSAETIRLVREARVPGHVEPIVVVAREPRRRRAWNIDALTASLIARGRHHWHQRTLVSIERALDYFTHAVERDDRAVHAWCGLADSWAVMGARGYASVTDAIARRGERRARAPAR